MVTLVLFTFTPFCETQTSNEFLTSCGLRYELNFWDPMDVTRNQKIIMACFALWHMYNEQIGCEHWRHKEAQFLTMMLCSTVSHTQRPGR
jgi:hypothetical protein